ncbi:MAG: anti-sigma factor family protein, partial [Blastocatellia bacterium]
MTEHLSDQQLGLYQGRTLTAEDIVSVNDHLFSCEDCFKRFQARSGLPRRPRTVSAHIIDFEVQEARECLTYEDMKAYVDSELSVEARSSIGEHLDQCNLCAAEVADLLLLKSSMAASLPSHSERIDPNPRETIPLVPSLGFTRVTAWRFGAGALTVAAAFGLIWFLMIAPLQRSIRLLRDQVDASSKNNNALLQKSEDRLNSLASRVNGLEKPPGSSALESVGTKGSAKVALNDGGRVISLERGAVTGLANPDFARMVKVALESSRIIEPS